MADRNMLVRALIRAAKVQGEASGKKPVEVLTDIITGKFSLDFSDGRTVISTSEAGGSVTFATMPNLGPDDVLAMAEEAIERLEARALASSNPPSTKKLSDR